MTRSRCLLATMAMLLTIAIAVDATTQHRRNVQAMGVGGGDMAAPKYDSGGYQSSGYGGGGGGGYGGGGMQYGGGGGQYGGGGGQYGGGGGGGYDDDGGQPPADHQVGGGDLAVKDLAKAQAASGDGLHDTGNVYYYYYPTQADKGDDYSVPSSYSSSYSSYNSYPPPPPPPAAYPMYYPMQYDDKDKDEGILGGLLGLGIPAALAVLLGIPLLLLGLVAGGAALAFFIGRSSDGSPILSAALKDDEGNTPHLPGAFIDLSLVRAVHEAFAAYQALSTDESCRQRVVCELGYVLKASESSKGTIISVLDAVLPTSLQPQFKPLREVLLSGESGKCQKYVCDAAAAALKRGPLKTMLQGIGGGTRSKGGHQKPQLINKTPKSTSETSSAVLGTNSVNATATALNHQH